MPTVITRDSYLVVNSVVLATPAWRILNLDDEMSSDSDVRGQDRLIPGSAGVRAKKRRRAVTVKQFEMWIGGAYDQTGAAYSDRRMGLITNVEYLKANLGLGYATGDGTVTATWHRYDTTTKAAAVHVTHFEVSDLNKRDVKAVLEISIPSGQFI